MTYLDANADPSNKHCFVGRLVRPQIIDNAQLLNKVPESSFDFVLGAHVLEHMYNFLGAIEAWVRSVRPGGFVMFALPDPCSRVDLHLACGLVQDLAPPARCKSTRAAGGANSKRNIARVRPHSNESF